MEVKYILKPVNVKSVLFRGEGELYPVGTSLTEQRSGGKVRLLRNFMDKGFDRSEGVVHGPLSRQET